MTLKPLSDYLVIKPLEAAAITASGIILPDTIDREKPEGGEIVYAGPGKLLDNGQIAAMNVKVGDKVMFKKYAPDEIKIEGVDYLVIRESDVILITE